jgi:hypothetical protein
VGRAGVALIEPFVDPFRYSWRKYDPSSED